MDGAVATSQSEHVDILNHTGGSCPSQQLHACLLSLSSSRSVDSVSKSVHVYNLTVYADKLESVDVKPKTIDLLQFNN